jgi:rhodanese-related sulfurtransferase
MKFFKHVPGRRFPSRSVDRMWVGAALAVLAAAGAPACWSATVSSSAAPPASPTELRVLLGVDPSDDSKGAAVNTTLTLSETLGRATHMRAAISRTGNMAEAMRASRTLENEILIAPAHVTASAILHAYTLLGTSGQQQTYVLIALPTIGDVSQLKGKRLYLPQQDSLRSYVAKGLLVESGVKLTQFASVTYGNTSDGGMLSMSLGMADATIAEESQAKDWIAKNPGQGHILKTSRPVPGGANLVVRKDYCASLCPKLTAWITSPDGMIAGTGRFQVAGPQARNDFTYVASLGITTPDTIAGVSTVGADQVAKLERSGAVLVDTRTQNEFESEHIRGAVFLPYVERSLKETDYDAEKDDFTAMAKLKDKAAPVVFLCNGPECWKSYKASRAALKAGFTKIYWFRGGMPEWREKSMPTEGSAVVADAKH